MEKGDNLVGREPRKPIKVGGGELGGSVAGSGGGDGEEEGANWDVGFTEKMKVVRRKVECRDVVLGCEGGGGGRKKEYGVCNDDKGGGGEISVRELSIRGCIGGTVGGVWAVYGGEGGGGDL